MTPKDSDVIPGSFEDRDKYIEVADGHNDTLKKKVKVQIKMYNNNRNNFIATLQNIILAPDLCDRFFNYYVNEFGTYLFISKRVVQNELQWQGKNRGYFTT